MSDTFLSIRITPEMAAALKAQQEKTGCPVSEYVRRAVAAALKAEKK